MGNLFLVIIISIFAAVIASALVGAIMQNKYPDIQKYAGPIILAGFLVGVVFSFFFISQDEKNVEKVREATYEEGYEAGYEKGKEDGYYDGHGEGYMEREREFDSWWEEQYYNYELFDKEETRAYARFAYVIGLLHGYEARSEHRQLLPFQGAKTEEEKEDAFYNLVGYYCPGEYYYDDIEEIAKEVYPAILK